MLVNAGISRFVRCTEYADASSKGLFKEAGIKYDKVERPSCEISHLD